MEFILLLAIAFALVVYDNISGLEKQVQEAWSGLGTQLTRRHALAMRIVDAVGAGSTATDFDGARVRAAQAAAVEALARGNVGRIERAEAELTGALDALFADGKKSDALANMVVMQPLQIELVEADRSVAVACEAYNSKCDAFSHELRAKLPKLMADMFGMDKRSPIACAVRASSTQR